MRVSLITPPTSEPVTLEEAKENLRITHNDYNTLLGQKISSAREWVEQRIQKKLITQTWELDLNCFPSTVYVEIPFGPVQSIAFVKYDNSDDDEQTIDPADYFVDYVIDPPRLYPSDQWPNDVSVVNGSNIRVRFVAGYTLASLVPNPIKEAIHLRVQQLYDGTDNTVAIYNTLTNYYTIFV